MSLFAAFRVGNARLLDNINVDLANGLVPFLKGKGLLESGSVAQFLKETNLVGSSFHKNLSDAFTIFKAAGVKNGLAEREIARQFVNGIVGDLPEAIRAGDPLLQASIQRSLRGLLDEPIEQTPKASTPNVYDFMTDLLRAKGKNNKSAEDFSTAQKALEESGQLHRGTAASLGRKDISTLSEIAKAVQRGEKITSDEFSRLKAGNPKQGILTAETPPTSQLAAVWNRVIGMVTGAPKAAGNFYGVPLKWDGIKSGQLWTRLGVSTAIATGVAFGAYEYGSGDARGLSALQRTAINTALKPIDLLTAELETISGEKKTTPLSDQTFLTLTSGKGLLNPRFVEYTQDLTGVDLSDPKYKGLSPNSLDTINLFIKLATSLQSTEARTFENKKGYNPETLFAYKWAVVSNLGLKGGEDAKSYDAIVGQLRERYEQAVYNALSNPNSPTPADTANRNYVLKTFLGTDKLPEDKNLVRDLLERFADDRRSGGTGAESLIRPAISKFLIKNGNVKGDEKSGSITIADAKEALKKFTEIGKTQQTETRDLAIAKREADAVAKDTELSEKRWSSGATPQSESQLPPSGDSRKKVKVSGARMAEILENFENDPDFPELKGKTTELARVFNSSRTPEAFTAELRRRGIPEATIEPLRDEGFVPPRLSR